MKKFFLAGVLGLVLTISAAFADHPSGWGIGIMGRGGWGYGHGGLGGTALSLKAPMPVYWGINLDMGSNYFGLGLTGDYYLTHRTGRRWEKSGWIVCGYTWIVYNRV